MTIELNAIDKAYGTKRVLRGLTFRVAAGEVYGLVGPNGAGKTTAINILCGLLRADSGRATVAGRPSLDNRRGIGVVPQEASVYERLTCRENLRLFAELYGLERGQAKARIEEVIAQLQLGAYADSRVGTLSGGWKRRVSIAVSIIHAPPALILDEPTAGLDLEARHELWQWIDRLRAAEVAILITTHQLDEAERLCSRVGILRDGRIAAEGSMETLRAMIPAAGLAVVETDNEAALLGKVHALGWELRRWGGRHTLWLPRRLGLRELTAALDGCAISSLALQEIGLEHVYLEITGGRPA